MSKELNEKFFQLNDKLIVYRKNYPSKKEDIRDIKQEMFNCIRQALQLKEVK